MKKLRKKLLQTGTHYAHYYIISNYQSTWHLKKSYFLNFHCVSIFCTIYLYLLYGSLERLGCFNLPLSLIHVETQTGNLWQPKMHTWQFSPLCSFFFLGRPILPALIVSADKLLPREFTCLDVVVLALLLSWSFGQNLRVVAHLYF